MSVRLNPLSTTITLEAQGNFVKSNSKKLQTINEKVGIFHYIRISNVTVDIDNVIFVLSVRRSVYR